MPPDVCPHCGAEIPRRAKVCPGCGADEQTGWSDKAYADNLGIPEENFDYEKYVKEEFGTKQVKPNGLHWIWWLTAVLLLIAFALCFLR
jgi:hypothetical protein